MAQPIFIGKVKLNKQGQLTLPQEARAKLNIETDSDMYWYEMNGFLVVTTDLDNLKDIEKKIKK